MDDLISRQAAIERIDAVFPVDHMRSEYAQGIASGAALAKTYVSQLPSAQPEIIRCKDCKWWTKQKDSLQGRCALFGMYPTGEWYCANAKMEVEHTVRGENDG